MHFYQIFICVLALWAPTGGWASSLSTGPDFQLAEDWEFLREPIVLNGQRAKPRDLLSQFTVRLKIRDRAGATPRLCTGVLVSHDLVLTAGHCLRKKQAQVVVQFGLGAARGFRHERVALDYESLIPPTSSSDPWQNGYLPFDEDEHRGFLEDVKKRKTWENFFGTDILDDSNFHDIALVHIKSAPSGYHPIPFYSGRLQFKQTVYVAGFGTNNRRRARNNSALRWMKMSLIGHYSKQGATTMGWQTYSGKDGGVCFGDSGGPLIVKTANGQWQLIGINIFVFNHCANSSFAVHAKFYRRWLQNAAQKMSSSLSI